MLIEITLLIIVVCLALKWGTKTFDFFEKQGIKYVKPYPFIGTSTWLFMRENIITIAKRYYDQFPNEKLYGLFNLREPFYVIRDPNLLKHLTIKESEYFLNHMNFIDFDSDEISSNMLILLRDEKWKQMRNALSPAFTSSKMRVMFDLISEVGQQMPDYFCEQYVKNGLVVQDVKDLFSRFTNDVIATCAFGIKCNSFRDPDNEFFQVGQ
ncbi:unnamed protein product [Hermetia illucens]|uniref:Cytochrome P450 n=3 Tax=Hermetia illucens TaxID=343691 RepID=A0A7R8YXX5_HERIL|nr:unnamed protein product [Hermetia illucens]